MRSRIDPSDFSQGLDETQIAEETENEKDDLFVFRNENADFGKRREQIDPLKQVGTFRNAGFAGDVLTFSFAIRMKLI